LVWWCVRESAECTREPPPTLFLYRWMGQNVGKDDFCEQCKAKNKKKTKQNKTKHNRYVMTLKRTRPQTVHPPDAHGVERRERLGVVVGELAGVGPEGLGLQYLCFECVCVCVWGGCLWVYVFVCTGGIGLEGSMYVCVCVCVCVCVRGGGWVEGKDVTCVV
jgi:hypothetical protein